MNGSPALTSTKSVSPTSSAGARLADFRAWLGQLNGADLSDRDRLELIAGLEELKSASAAAQARVTVAFDESQRSAHEGRGGKPDEVARSIGSQVALARRDSPSLGDRHVGLAKALVRELPSTMKALAAGTLSEYRAMLVAKETACLSREHRMAVDARLAPDLPKLGNRSLAAAARRIAAELDAASVVRRMEAAVSSRRVTVRPAPDGMAWLTFLAPMADAIGAYAALGRLADSSLAGQGADPAGRSRDQLMVDLALDRLFGRASGEKVDVAVQLVMTPDDLFGAGATPAQVSGFGPIPAAFARAMVCAADKVWLRRLFTSPDRRNLVAMDSRRRLFDGSLRELIVLRDQTCRTPWCDAPIRAADHANPARAGGPTSAANGVGLCERCNYTKEAPGWRVDVTRTGLDPGGGNPHTIMVTTPTGQTHTSVAPPVLGWGSAVDTGDANSPLERHLLRLLAA